MRTHMESDIFGLKNQANNNKSAGTAHTYKCSCTKAICEVLSNQYG